MGLGDRGNGAGSRLLYLDASVVCPSDVMVKGSKTQLKALSEILPPKHSFSLARKWGRAIPMLMWHVGSVIGKTLKQRSTDGQRQPHPRPTASGTMGKGSCDLF